MRDIPICFPILTILYLVSNGLYFHIKWRKGRHFWCEDCRFVCFETGLGKPMLTLNGPNGLKKIPEMYILSISNCEWHSSVKSVGKWKYVNPCLDFLGIPDQRTAYVKRQVRPGWTYVRRSSVTPDLRKIPRWPGPPLILGECPPSRGPTTTTSIKKTPRCTNHSAL